jgi:hypothetical protein
VPAASRHHWRGIRARLSGFEEVRAARIDSDHNPAHPLANTPDRYAHVNRELDRCLIPGAETDRHRSPEGCPPPSRRSRHDRASD